jgi:hypothetical protein
MVPTLGTEPAEQVSPRVLIIAVGVSFVWIKMYSLLPRLSGNVLSAKVNASMIKRDSTSARGKSVYVSAK